MHVFFLVRGKGVTIFVICVEVLCSTTNSTWSKYRSLQIWSYFPVTSSFWVGCNIQFLILKLLGNKLYGLEKENKDGQEKLFYRELNIDSNQMKDLCEVEKDPTIEMESGVRRQYFTVSCYLYFWPDKNMRKILAKFRIFNNAQLKFIKRLKQIIGTLVFGNEMHVYLEIFESNPVLTWFSAKFFAFFNLCNPFIFQILKNAHFNDLI